MLSIEWRSERGDTKLSIYISRLIESNNARLIAFGEERIGRKGLPEKGWENLFRQLDRTIVANRVIRIVGESAFSLILIFAQPVGMDKPYVTLIALLVFVTLYICRLDKLWNAKN